MNDIKRWQERCAYKNPAAEIDSQKLAFACAEIAELRAALEAARATPAQPVPVNVLSAAQAILREHEAACATDPMFALLEMAEDDEEALVSAVLLRDLFDAVRATPSPSSVGDAIRAMKLPEPLEIDWPQLNSNALGCGVEDRNIRDRYEAAEYGWQDGVDRTIERVPEDNYTSDQVRALLSEAAALAEQAQGQQWVSVKERLPEFVKRWDSYLEHEKREIPAMTISDRCAVLVDGAVEIDRAVKIDGRKGAIWQVYDYRVTHWMPLPAAPSTAQDGQKSEADHDA